MPARISDLEVVFSNVVKIALTAVGMAVLVMLIVGGFQYLTAGGDKEAAGRAQRTLTFAIGGLVLAVSAYLILNLLGNFLGVNFSVFRVTL